MQLIETTLTGSSIRMRYANSADPATATRWLDFHVALGDLLDPRSTRHTPTPLGDADQEFFGGLKLAALRHVQALVVAEIQRLREAPHQTF